MTNSIWQHFMRRTGGTCTVFLSGELDLSSVNELTVMFLAEAERPGTRVIRADLRLVRFLDSSAIGALIKGYRAAQSTDTAFLISGAQGQVRTVLDTAGVLWLIDGCRTPTT